MTKEERLAKQLEKLTEMKIPEAELRKKGYKAIAGVDEVGRGPLAGPVVAAAVIMPEDFDIPGIDDSKKLSEKKREELYEIIKEKAVAYSIGIVEHEVIDEVNILQATKLAMKKAIAGLSVKPDYVLFDAVKLEEIDVPQESIIKGDAKVLAIAAASIIAKVTRDRMMVEYAKEYPWYAFEKNKGYGTKAHYEGIYAKGTCPIHRMTFLKNLKK